MSRKQKKRGQITGPLIDVVIVTGGRFDMLSKCIDALEVEARNVPMAVYIVDNATDADEYRDNSHLFFKREGSSFITLQTTNLRKEAGYSEANNLAAKQGHSPLIMFLNDDVELVEGSVQKVVDTFQDETIGVVGIKLLFPLTSTSPIRPAGKIQHVGMALSIRGDPEHPLIGWSSDNPRANQNRDVIATTGACLTIRRQLFNKVGGFDPVYGLGTWEDVDLCFKVRQAGHRIYVNTSAWGYHYTGSTSEKKKRPFPILQNKMIFQSKWANTGLMAWTSQDFW